MLIFGQDGAASVVERDTARMAEICRAEGAISVEVAADEDAAGKLLAARRGAIPALARLAPTLILEDATVPRSELAGMVRDVQRIAEEEGLLIAVFGHAGDGNLHPTCCIDDRDPDQVARVHRAFDRIFEAALARGGTITGEHGIGVTKLHVPREAPGPGRHRAAARHQARVRPARAAQPRQGGAVTRAGCRGAGPRAVSGRPAAHLHLVRVLPVGLPDLPGHAQRGVVAARPHQPDARARGGHARRGRRARGAVVLPRLPRVRARLPGRRALRRAARARPRRHRARHAIPSCPACCWRSARRAGTRLVGRMMRIGPAARPAPASRRPARCARAAGRRRSWPRRRPGACAGSVGPEDGEPAALFLGCVGHLMFSGAAHAACGTLATAGYRVTTPREQGCCGALHAHNGDLEGARELADWTIASFAGSEGPIVTTAGGCGAFMADYGTLLGTPEAQAFGGRVRDYSTLLAGRELPALHGAPAAGRLPGLVPPAQRPEGHARAARAARLAARRRGRRPAERRPLLRRRRHVRADAARRLAALPRRQARARSPRRASMRS